MLFVILGVISAIGVWYWRLTMAREAARDIGNIAGDLINAPRRLGFRRRANAHLVEGVDDPKLAIAAISLAFLELGGLPAREDQHAVRHGLRLAAIGLYTGAADAEHSRLQAIEHTGAGGLACGRGGQSHGAQCSARSTASQQDGAT